MMDDSYCDTMKANKGFFFNYIIHFYLIEIVYGQQNKENVDIELGQYLNRSYWDKRGTDQQKSV